jgi:thiamine pyridinylase
MLAFVVPQSKTVETNIHPNISPVMENIGSNNTATTILKVAPYPYLPDSVGDQFKSLLEFIKTQFDTVHPDVSLELRPMNSNDDFYDLSTLSQWLASNGSGYDVVEIDTILLGDLVNAGLVAPQFVIPDNHSDWIPAAANAV